MNDQSNDRADAGPKQKSIITAGLITPQTERVAAKAIATLPRHIAVVATVADKFEKSEDPKDYSASQG
jgi:hypothetical protein